MASYELVSTDTDLSRLVHELDGRQRVAVDIEGENNLHAYGIRVCLVQLFDGKRGYLVDALAVRDRSVLRQLLEESGWTKVMFDSANDLLALRHDLGIRLAPLCDLAIAARLLGMTGGLRSHLERRTPGAVPSSARSKDRFQKANWLRRPLPPAMLEYALSDVVDLLRLADQMTAELEARGLPGEFDRLNREAAARERSWDPLGNFTRIPGFPRLPAAARRLAKTLWYAREYYARALDLPPEAVASKPQLAAIAARGLSAAEDIAAFLNDGRARNRVDPRDLAVHMAEAARDAAADPRRG
jgi:ribonuclease D